MIVADGGTLIAEGLKLHNNDGMGIQVNGVGSTVYIRNSSAYSNLIHGMNVREGGTLFADRVNVYRNDAMGIRARGVGSTVYIRNSSAYSNLVHGLDASGGGALYATNMLIHGNTEIGFNVSGELFSDGNTDTVSSYGYITDSLIYNNRNEGLLANLVINVENDGKQDNYLDLADFERKGETAPTLIAERVQVFNNGIADPEESFSGATNFGAIMKISDSSIWGNGWSGVWTAGWHGRADITNSDNIYYANGRTVLENVTIFDNLGNGVDSRGGQVTVTNSNVFGNTHDQYVNFTGLSHRDEFSTVFCIRSGGYVDVGPVRIGNNPIGASGGETPNCGLASEVTLSDPQTKPFPVFPAFPAFPSPFLP